MTLSEDIDRPIIDLDSAGFDQVEGCSGGSEVRTFVTIDNLSHKFHHDKYRTANLGRFIEMLVLFSS